MQQMLKGWIVGLLWLAPNCLCSCQGTSAVKADRHLEVKQMPSGLQLVRIPAGEFRMGYDGPLPAIGLSTKPVHKVRLSSFWMSQFEVTNRSFELFKKRVRGENSPGDNDPVGGVSYADVQAYIKWLSKRDGCHYSLPSEAQWEYAARGGLEDKDYPWGNESPDGRALIGGLKCKPVGSYEPNQFGLYDMCGNIAEYVIESPYNFREGSSVAVDPVGPNSGDEHIVRGLGVSDYYPHIWTRESDLDELPMPYTGFRLVAVFPSQESKPQGSNSKASAKIKG